MIRRSIFSFISLLTLSSIFSTNVSALPEDDTQLWTETWLSVPVINDEILGGLVNFTRIGRDVSHLTDERTGPFTSFRFSDTMRLTFAYLYVEQQLVRESRRRQHRLLTDLDGAYSMTPRVRLLTRLRSERIMHEGPDNLWNFRPRVGADIRLPTNTIDVRSFLLNEFFYNSESRDWSRLRVTSGFSFRPSPLFSFDLYGGRELQQNFENSDISIAGIIFRIQAAG